MAVAAARHIEPKLTGSSRAQDLKDHPHAIDAVRAVFAARITCCGLTTENANRSVAHLDHLLSEWLAIADEQTRSGDPFCYDMQATSEVQRLLQEPLKYLPSDPNHRRAQFAAARSMRDTEPSALLKLCEPGGKPL